MLVIGNGVSRKDIPLDKIYQEKIGCNAIFRDHYVQHLVCCDKRMVKQALQHHDTIYTRQRWNEELGVLPLPNLIKEGTEGYNSADSYAVDHSYWVHQIAKVFEWFPNHCFTIYNKQGWKLPKSWNLDNVSLDTLDKL